MTHTSGSLLSEGNFLALLLPTTSPCGILVLGVERPVETVLASDGYHRTPW